MSYPLGVVVQNAGNYTETITTGGTWTAPTIATDGFTASNISVQVIAGGGRSATSGGLDTTGASGAGGGAYSKLNSFTATPGTGYTATVGAGAGGVNTAGGDSWFSTTGTVLAKGGNPGAANGGAVGAGGASASGVGDTKFSGGNGGVGGLAAGGGGGGGAGSGGAGGNASGTTPGTGTATGGGSGGASNAGAGNVQGGGGGGANGLGAASGGGARGYVVLTYNKQFSRTPTESVGGSDNGTNLYTGDQTDFEAGVGGWTTSLGVLSSSTDQAFTNTHSLKLVTSTTVSHVLSGPKVAVSVGTTYRARYAIRSGAVRTTQIFLTFYDSGGVALQSVASQGVVTSTSAWKFDEAAGKAPPSTVTAGIQVIVYSPADAENHYIDAADIATTKTRTVTYNRTVSENVVKPTDAVARTYSATRNVAEAITSPTDSVARQFIGSRTISEAVGGSDNGANLYTGNDADFESGIGSWTSSPVATLSSSTDQAFTGTHSLKMVTTSSGNHSLVGAVATIVAGTFYRGRCALRAGATPRLARGALLFFDAGFLTIASYLAPIDVTTSTSAWQFTEVASKAPPNAVYLAFGITITGMASSETVYVDTADLATTKARAVTYNRSLAESITAPTDSIARMFSANRTISENIAKPTDAVTRTAAFNRAIAESITAPTDSVARITNVLRTINESIAKPTDSVARTASFNRGVTEQLPGPSSGSTVTYVFNVMD